MTVIEHRLKVFMGGVTFSMSFLIFVAAKPFKSLFAVHVTVVLNYMIKQSCSIFFLMWLVEFLINELRSVFSCGMQMGAIRASPPSL